MAEEKNSQSRKRLLVRFMRYVRDRFDLKADNAHQPEVIENITKTIEFKGTNLWILIFASFIASLGLNVNSTVVIIGAMLISPLMGPIMGIGLSLGINDYALFKKSLRNFIWMVVVVIVTSAFYFLISPISGAQSEMLARTNPTTYDVLIAFLGGAAGMVAHTRRERGMSVISVILGVAIATTLLPPLCTIGFGLVTGNFRFVWGALYLFLINAVFIALATYLVVTLLKYEKKEDLDRLSNKKVKRYMIIFAVLTIIPSAFLTVDILNRTRFENDVDKYVSTVFQFEKTLVVDYTKGYRVDGKTSRVEMMLIGEPLTQNVLDNARAQMENYGLTNTELFIKQASEGDKIDFSNIQKSYSEIINEKNRTIEELEGKLYELTVSDTLPSQRIAMELGAFADNIKSASISRHVNYTTEGLPLDTTVICLVRRADPSVRIDTEKIKNWLQVRVENDKILVYTQLPQSDSDL